MHLTDKEVGKDGAGCIVVKSTTSAVAILLFGLAWFQPNAVTTSKCGKSTVVAVVAPGATELHLVQLVA